jgi:hypothetical protein
VTEAEWLASTSVGPMIAHLWSPPCSLTRKLRLFAAACCRRVWRLLPDEASRSAIVVAESFADKLASITELKKAFDDAGGEGFRDEGHRNPAGPAVGIHVVNGAIGAAIDAHTLAGQHDAQGRRVEYDRTRSAVEELFQVDLLRDIIDNPFRPVTIGPAWFAPAVVSLAHAAYEERNLPSGELDPHRLIVLADALEEAGAPAELVAHLRSSGPHVRGCFAVDLVLGLT